jgi:hypothetical protein
MGWKGYLLENDVARLHVAPDIGGRVIQYALGEKEFFWVNPTLAGKKPPQTGLDPNGGWLNYGGDKLWPAPQGWDNDAQWAGPPDAVLDGQPYRAEIDRDRCAIHLTSRDDPRSGIRFRHNGLGRIYAYNKWTDMPDNRADTPYVFESEVLSPYARLQPGESFTWRYEWIACRIGGDFPVLRCNEAGLVSEPLQCQRDGGRVRLQGRFGVFHLGRLVLEVYDEQAELLGVDILDTNATPTRPVSSISRLVDSPCAR